MIIYQDSQLTIFQSALYQTNSLIYKAASFILLVDPNWLPAEVQLIRNYIDENGEGKPIYLLFTHSDYDHIIACGLFPEAKIIASERFQNNSEKEKVLSEIKGFDQQHYLQRTYPIIYPEVDIVISQDGQQIEVEGERLIFYLSHGHNGDGIFTVIESAGIFIAGDYLSDIEFPFIYFSSGDYMDALKKVDHILQTHIVYMMVPGHGQFLKDQNKEILIRKDRDLQYIQDLRNCISNQRTFPLEDWLSQFPFPDGLTKEHEKNEKHIKIELEKQEVGD